MSTRRGTRTVLALAVTGLAFAACVNLAPLGSPNASASPSPSLTLSPIPTLTLLPTPSPTVPPTETPQPTAAPTPEPTAPPTDAPTQPPTAPPTPSPTPTDSPSATPTDSPSPTPTTQATFNFSLPGVYGSTALTSGFVPDPFSVGVTAGGPVNAAYLGGGCSGFATSAPSFQVNYTSGAFPTLRFYFIGGADTTMIINTPGGSYVCVDDSFGTLNPTIDFSSPSSGRYDVWIGTFAAGGSVGGTLYVTENTGNHP